MQTLVYGPTLQATGAFDGGNITEQKPIGFPGEGSVVKRVGPLFYWAWAHSRRDGYIGLHPHQAFEIMTYVIHGKAEHGDTLGTRSTVGPGGVQIMQTGSGVSHEERFIGPDMEGFQIWFEPHFDEALNRKPTYHQFEHEQFPIVEGDGYVKKTVIGQGAPVEIVVDALMWDVEIQPGREYHHSIPSDRTLTALAIRGAGAWSIGPGDEKSTAFHHKDFIVAQADDAQEIAIRASDEAPLRLILIEVPTKVDYPLYPKR
ncbi:pirin family protein [Paenibacillus oenotherae]|uniref:Pirin family protein n=1 Tax=Paenibacillus oenotherae TaxID=1435645 RepID=A0ABS7DAC8_9BACL|nr:pirin family protein [Paenibacillus oenotherae]MBW7476899.1 pirin family protein [Paenibacillus oenotherae]